MSDATAEIKKLEDRRFQSMIDGDFDTLDKLLGDDLIYTHSTGQSDTRAEYIAQCKTASSSTRKSNARSRTSRSTAIRSW